MKYTYNPKDGSIVDILSRFGVSTAFKTSEEIQELFKDLTSTNVWNILDHPEFPFLSLETANKATKNFPPFNIIDHNGKTRLDLAVVGYSKDRLSVELDGTTLIIRGQQKKPLGLNSVMRKQGISDMAFVRSFAMQPHTVVDDVSLKDGLLSIVLYTKKPETGATKFDIK
jgi:HSP20 family molecular chaperone IbpA